VYVSGETPSGAWTVTKYSIDGEPLQTFSLVGSDRYSGWPSISLAPDECTLVYGGWGMSAARLNVCTDTQIPPTGLAPFQWVDDLAVLPNWDVVAATDEAADLWSDDLTQELPYDYRPPPTVDYTEWVRYVGLDPDGTSFWTCCWPLRAPPGPGPNTLPANQVLRFDIATGQVLAQWTVDGLSPIAVYGPPLLGNANVERAIDSESPGTAQAFVTRSTFSGQMTRLHVYVDSSSAASRVMVGVYSNQNGRPGRLMGQATLSSPMAGSWNYVDVPPISVTAGQRCWIAVLGPYGGGSVSLRDATGGQTSETSAQQNLAALPTHWSSGASSFSAPLSAYGS
jgi:hypothetical protein